MATSAISSPCLDPPKSCMDRLDAAHALLGVSPKNTSKSLDDSGSWAEKTQSSSSDDDDDERKADNKKKKDENTMTSSPRRNNEKKAACGLDALAALATNVVKGSADNNNTNNNNDSLSMPPPPPKQRRHGRLRSASNPEGMEKWDSLSRTVNFTRKHFVLPSSVLQDELISASVTCCGSHAELGDGVGNRSGSGSSLLFNIDEDDDALIDNGALILKNISTTPMTSLRSAVEGSSSNISIGGLPLKKRGGLMRSSSKNDDDKAESSSSSGEDFLGTSPSSVMLSSATFEKRSPKRGFSEETTSSSPAEVVSASSSSSSLSPDTTTTTNGSSPQKKESDLEPEELLRRARARLLEDLTAEVGMSGEKGVLPLPHSLSKYKEVYNKNGRIGIYTPAERVAIIAKFNSKRSRRVWNKKIRYNCRKNLADRRMRVKGRFVKRSTEQQATAAAALVLTSTSGVPIVPSQQHKQEKKNCLIMPRPSSSSSSRAEEADVTPSSLLSPSDDDDDVTVSSSAPKKSISFSPHDCVVSIPSSRTTRTTSLTTITPTVKTKTGKLPRVDEVEDVDMPDVNDPEAGFIPTEDQPYRRTRRHTIT